MAAPTVRAVGAVASGVDAISPGLPAGTVANDLLIMVLETKHGQAITVSGWTEAPSSPKESGVDVTNGSETRLTVFYRISDGADPTLTSDSTNHQVGRIIGITEGTYATPFNNTANVLEDQYDLTGTTITGLVTGVADCLVVVAVSVGLPDTVSTTAFSGWTNANLTGITERIDNRVADGGGGGIGVMTGEYAGTGNFGATTYTLEGDSYKAMWVASIAPYVASVDEGFPYIGGGYFPS